MRSTLKFITGFLVSGGVFYGSDFTQSPEQRFPQAHSTKVPVTKKETPEEYRERKIIQILNFNLLTETEARRAKTIELDAILRKYHIERFRKHGTIESLSRSGHPKNLQATGESDALTISEARRLLAQATLSKQENKIADVISCCGQISRMPINDSEILLSCVELLYSINQTDEEFIKLCNKVLSFNNLPLGKRLSLRIILINLEADMDCKKQLVAQSYNDAMKAPHLMVKLGQFLLNEDSFLEEAYRLLQQACETSEDPKIIYSAIKLLSTTVVPPAVYLSSIKKIKTPMTQEADVLAKLFLDHKKINEAVEVYKSQTLAPYATRFFPEWLESLTQIGAIKSVIEIYEFVMQQNQNIQLATIVHEFLKKMVDSTIIEPADREKIMELWAQHDSTPRDRIDAMIELLKAKKVIRFTKKHYDTIKQFPLNELNHFLKMLMDLNQIDESITIVQTIDPSKSKVDTIKYLLTWQNLKKEVRVDFCRKIEQLDCDPPIKIYAIELLKSYRNEYDDIIKNLCIQVSNDEDASYDEILKVADILRRIDPEAAKIICLNIADDVDTSYDDILRSVSILANIDPAATKMLCLNIADDEDASYENIFRAATILSKIDHEAANVIFQQLRNDPNTPEHIWNKIKT